MRTLREEFREFCPLTAEETSALDGPIYVLDSNVLLHLYRYSEPVRLKFIELLRLVRKQLFIPYQVAFEFHRNRPGVIAEQLAIAEKIVAALDTEIEKVSPTIEAVLTHKHHPYIDRSELLSTLKNSLLALRTRVLEGSQQYDAGFTDDPVLPAIHEVIEGQVGDPFSADELAQIYKEGEDRYLREIPPGYKDIKKPVPERYGDLVLWKEVIRHGRANKCALVFVTDDRKEDWIWRSHGKTISMRPELRREYYDSAGQPVSLYTPERFMQDVSKRLGKTVEDPVLHEISETSETARLRGQLEEVTSLISVGNTSEHMTPSQPIPASEEILTTRREGDLTPWRSSELFRLAAADALRKALGLDALEQLRTSMSVLGGADTLRKALGLDALEQLGTSISALGAADATRNVFGRNVRSERTEPTGVSSNVESRGTESSISPSSSSTEPAPVYPPAENSEKDQHPTRHAPPRSEGPASDS